MPEAAVRPTAPNPLWLLLEGPRLVLESATLAPSVPVLWQAPRGDGHPVMVLPGFWAGDQSTRVLREYLRRLGYGVHRWLLGRNTGLPEGAARQLMDRVTDLHRRYGHPVSLVGWSLGGIYARELARLVPHAVRQVITLSSPFGGEHRGHRAGWLHRAVTGEDIPPELRRRMNRNAGPLPVPSTAIFSKSDGVVGWRACIEPEAEHTENIEVVGSHCGLGFNPVVLYAVADRLSQPKEGRKSFDKSGLRRLFYS